MMCRAFSLFAFAVLASLALPAMSGSLTVTPVRVDLSNAQRSIALTVRNDGDQPAVVQAQLVSWSQENNDDKLEPTTELLASPPIFTIPAGGAQVLRVALRRTPDSTVERSYRILVTEVPGKPQPGFTGAQFALKISLPIFVEPTTAKPTTKLEWSAKRAANGELALTTSNSGTRHIQIHTVELTNSVGSAATPPPPVTQATPDATFASMWYVLPGQRRTMMIKPAPGRALNAGRIRVTADSDAGPISADVVVDPS